MKLYDELIKDSSILSESEILKEFSDSISSTVLGIIYNVKKISMELDNDSISTLTENSLNDSRLTLIEMIDGLIPETTIESNEKKYTLIFLNTIAMGKYEIDSLQYVQLKEIAIQCPFIGGKVVYEARALIKIHTDTLVYDDYSACVTPHRMSSTIENNQNSTSLLLFPNPANSEIYLQIDTQHKCATKFIIYDCVGRQIKKVELTSLVSPYKVNTGDISSGFYTYKLILNDRIINKGKFSIVH